MAADLSQNTTAVSHAANVGRLLIARKLSCAVAESCTGGMIGAAITSVAGSSGWFRGGVIAYSNEVKMRLLGVPEQVLAEHGAVSAETVTAMAEGVAKLLGADCSVSVSGIAGPGGGSDAKPVGLVYIGIFMDGKTSVFRHKFAGERAAVRNTAAVAALQHLFEHLSVPASSPL
jgi:PncC family amidohydrolase